jgi:hypothetical protein
VFCPKLLFDLADDEAAAAVRAAVGGHRRRPRATGADLAHIVNVDLNHRSARISVSNFIAFFFVKTKQPSRSSSIDLNG